MVPVFRVEMQGLRAVASTDLMEQVRKLNEDNTAHPAAPIVLAGAALEVALRSAIEELQLRLPDGQRPSIGSYVVNSGSGTVTPIRTATGTALKPIKVGSNPDAIAITPGGKTAYVVLSIRFGRLRPIRTATNTALKAIKAGNQPDAIAITP